MRKIYILFIINFICSILYVEADEPDILFYYNNAIANFLQKEYEQAIKYFTKVIELDPHNVDIYTVPRQLFLP